jgi:hypothetical protein
MARRKKHAHHHRRRRRVGAIGMGNILTNVAGIAAGAAAGAFVRNIIKKNFATLPAFVAPAGVVVLGVLTPKLLKNEMGKAVSAGLIGSGSLFLLSGFGVTLPGITGVSRIGLTYKATPKLQQTVGAPGFVNNPIGAVADMRAIGALYDN